ncbi:hypothetical protein HK097_006871, partial [Rhizophlyctis rosea]
MSSYSNEVRQMMDDGTIPRSPVNIAVKHEGGVYTYYSGKKSATAPNEDLMTTVDISSCYPTNMLELRSPIPVFTSGDNTEPATEMREEDGPCQYLVEVEAPEKVGASPFWLGNRAYDRDVVQRALDAGTEFKIVGKNRASQCIPKDFFNAAMEEMKRLLPPKEFKMVSNSTVGFFGIHRDTTGTKSYQTDDPSMMSYIYWSVLEHMQQTGQQGELWVENLPNGGYVVHTLREKNKVEDHRSIHSKIIQHTYIRLFDLFEGVRKVAPGVELVQVKTDSMTFEFPDQESKARADAYLATLTGLKRE